MKKYPLLSLAYLVVSFIGSLFMSCQEVTVLSNEEMAVSFVVEIDGLSAEDRAADITSASLADLVSLAVKKRLEVRYQLEPIGKSEIQKGCIPVLYSLGEFFTLLTPFPAADYMLTSFELWDCGEIGKHKSRLLFAAEQPSEHTAKCASVLLEWQCLPQEVSLADKEYDEVALSVGVFRAPL